MCLITALFAPPVLASLVFDFGSAVVLTTFLVSALLFLPGMLIAGLAFVQIGAFQMRDKIQREKTQDLINKRNGSFLDMVVGSVSVGCISVALY
ncbi:hypothetical protein D1823_12645 [Ruegeria sp. AD91A]|nr:hypothetical protein D1823_12645 [Ruegeria sp. AD91A]